mmetsp:Transcript_17334/g.52040  ORF Transcript_17334/g.52040 Transcript_17334/m.52040 type:complete len:277 (-) Transcript_17334:437-1267(-)
MPAVVSLGGRERTQHQRNGNTQATDSSTSPGAPRRSVSTAHTTICASFTRSAKQATRRKTFRNPQTAASRGGQRPGAGAHLGGSCRDGPTAACRSIASRGTSCSALPSFSGLPSSGQLGSEAKAGGGDAAAAMRSALCALCALCGGDLPSASAWNVGLRPRPGLVGSSVGAPTGVQGPPRARSSQEPRSLLGGTASSGRVSLVARAGSEKASKRYAPAVDRASNRRPDTKTMASPASVTESVQTRSLVIMGCERAQRICRAVGSSSASTGLWAWSP